MISTLVRKARTLIDTFHDFYSDPLASFHALEQGLEDRRKPVPPELESRVLAAYEAAKRDQAAAGPAYQANGEWTLLTGAAQQSFRDRTSINHMLESFFRHREAFGGLAEYAASSYLEPRRNVKTRVVFANSMLHDYRVWSDLTGKKIEAVRAPSAGNPFGYFIDGTLAVPATFRHHYMAEKAVALIGGKGIVAELGGGWGDVGFFVLQSPGVHYVDIDLPETLLLASYWLCSTVPGRKIALYGEEDTRTVVANLEKYDAVLLPNFCLSLLPKDSVDIFLNARSLSEMRSETVAEYLGQITRVSRRYFLHENSDRLHENLGHIEVPASSFATDGFRLLNKAISPWKAGGGRYREFLYEKTAA